MENSAAPLPASIAESASRLPGPLQVIIRTFLAIPDAEDFANDPELQAASVMGSSVMAISFVYLYAGMCSPADCTIAKDLILRATRERVTALTKTCRTLRHCSSQGG